MPNTSSPVRTRSAGIVLWQSAAARRKLGLERLAPMLGEGWTVRGNPREQGDPDLDEMREALATAEVLIAGWGCKDLPAGLYEAAPRLRLACLLGSSVKPLRPAEAWARQVMVTNTAAAIAEGVAEYVLGGILLWLHKHDFYDRGMKSGADWHEMKAARDQRNLCDTVVGLVGCGLVGMKLGTRLRLLGARVRVYDPFVPAQRLTDAGFEPAASLDELLQASDIVSLHAGSTPGTRHMLGSRELGLLGDGALFVNSARAALVDESALVDELRRGRIDAFLDVFAEEPLPRDHPLRSLPNTHLAPHAAASSNLTVRRLMLEAVAQDIRGLTSGTKPVSLVTPEMYARMT